MVKEVAQTIKDMASGELMAKILNRSSDIVEDARILKDHWSYDLLNRRPGPAYFENGVLKPTDLDLACFLSALADREAIVVLPKYKSRRASHKVEGEHLISKDNRNGKIVNLTSNKEVFSFSIRVIDQNVIISDGEGDKQGAFRNFMLVDIDGSWWDGWEKIEFVPNVKENKFIEEFQLGVGGVITFKDFVHPLRWTSFYGQYYFLTKTMISRLEEEAKIMRAAMKQLPKPSTASSKGYGHKGPKSTRISETKTELVTAFQCEIDVPWNADFVEHTKDWEEMNGRLKDVNNSLAHLRFATRATELSFFKAGMKNKGFPGWIRGAKWEEGYVPEGRRTTFNRLVLTQILPGQIGFALRYRTWEKKETVAA